MKISLLYLKKHIQNRSIVGKYNLLKRNSLRTILFLNKTKNNRMGILMVTADILYVDHICPSNLETRRQLEPKWIPQLFLDHWGLGIPTNSPRKLCAN